MTLHVRRARPTDRAAMLAITRTVWEGHDYVPSVWNRWLHDVNGAVLVAERDGAVVGLQHAVLHPDGSAWLEGIRVAPEQRDKGVGAALLHAGIRWATDAGCSAVRLSTASDNPASNRLVEKAGFVTVGRFRPLRGQARYVPSKARLALPSDFGMVWEAVREIVFYTEGWTAYRLTPLRLALLLAQYAVVVSGTAVVIATATRRWGSPRIGLSIGREEEIVDAVRLVQSRASELGLGQIRAAAADRPESVAALERAGFETGYGWEETMLLNELELTDSP